METGGNCLKTTLRNGMVLAGKVLAKQGCERQKPSESEGFCRSFSQNPYILKNAWKVTSALSKCRCVSLTD
jgi:hypothetical protein